MTVRVCDDCAPGRIWVPGSHHRPFIITTYPGRESTFRWADFSIDRLMGIQPLRPR